MTYTDAVEMALKGDAAGFEFLYNSTKNHKYYLALKYVKNEETAQDVLQEAYIRAWKNLDKLKEPERFDSWLAQIVVNTAKNELEKRNHTPLDLRVESSEEEDDMDVIDRAVSSWDNVPELEYTREETRQLVHELIDSLSDEQRLVVIAFELEGLTTREIAEQLGCSEATVKSRLRYGRNNIKQKAEELEKKGYKLYSMAPLPLLLYLLRRDMDAVMAEPAAKLALSKCGEKILRNTNVPLQINEAAGNVASAAKKISFLSTKAGKIVAGAVLTVAVAGGAAAGVIHYNRTASADTTVEETQNRLDIREEQGIKEEPEDQEILKDQEEQENADSEDSAGSIFDALAGGTETEEPTVHDEVGWSDAYNMILQHVPDNTLTSVSEVGFYGFEKEIYDNLTQEGEPFEYALVDLDKDGIPELLIRANTSQTTYNGMSYWIIVTYQKSIIDGNYTEMPVMSQTEKYPVIEGIASVGGSRVYVKMNETMDEFFVTDTSAGNGNSYTYRVWMEYDSGIYRWRKEETGFYTWEQENELAEASSAYPVEIEWKSLDTPFEWQ